MVHSGYEGSAVNYTFGSLRGLWQTAKAMMNLYPDKGALDLLNEPAKPVHGFNPLVQIEQVQIETQVRVEEGTRV
jgi:hypothetical protein